MTRIPMQQSRSEQCLSDLQLDWLRVDSSTSSKAAEASAHLAECKRCQSRQAWLHAETARAEASLPPLLSIAPRQSTSQTQHRRAVNAGIWLRLSGVAAVAAALLLWLSQPFTDLPHQAEGTPPSNSLDTTTQTRGTRAKGTHRLEFFVNRDGQVHRGTSSEVLYPGDAVRFASSSPVPHYVTVLSLDNSGAVSVYHADDDARALRDSGQTQILPGAIALDEVLGPERVYGVFCSSPTRAAELASALKANAESPNLPQGCAFSVVNWVKQVKP